MSEPPGASCANPTTLEHEIEASRRYTLERRERERAEIDDAYAAELKLALSGHACNERVLARAPGVWGDLYRAIDAAGPELVDRHRAALDWTESNDPEERTARHDALTRVMRSNDPARKEARVRQAQARAEGFFGRPAQLAVTEEGEGNEARPQYRTNPQTFVTTFTIRHNPDGSSEQLTGLCRIDSKWRLAGQDSPAFAKRVNRYVKQLESETVDTEGWSVDYFHSESDWLSLTAVWRQRKKRDKRQVRYLRMPQDNGRIVVIHNSPEDLSERGGALVDDPEIWSMALRQWLWTPDDKRVGSSAGFGGNYRGARGDGRRKAAEEEGAKIETVGQYITTGAKGLHGAAELLGIKLSKRLSGERELDHDDAALVLYEAGYTLKLRHSHMETLGDQLTRLLGLEEPPKNDVTNKAQIEETDLLCLIRDIDPPKPNQAALHLPDLPPEEPPPVPILLDGVLI